MRPIVEGLVSYEAVFIDGKIDLVDLARMNDAIDARIENSNRINRAQTKDGAS